MGISKVNARCFWAAEEERKEETAKTIVKFVSLLNDSFCFEYKFPSCIKALSFHSLLFFHCFSFCAPHFERFFHCSLLWGFIAHRSLLEMYPLRCVVIFQSFFFLNLKGSFRQLNSQVSNRIVKLLLSSFVNSSLNLFFTMEVERKKKPSTFVDSFIISTGTAQKIW